MELNLFHKPISECSNTINKCKYYVAENNINIMCIKMSEEFLLFLKKRGYLLVHENYEKDDTICLCVYKWLEAYNAGVAPKIIPEATNLKVLNYVPMDILSKYF